MIIKLAFNHPDLGGSTELSARINNDWDHFTRSANFQKLAYRRKQR